MDADAFARSIHDALTHFHDRGYLQSHALARALLDAVPDGREGPHVQQLLLDAIEELKPSIAGRPDLPEWRGYRYLLLRYVEKLSHEEVVQQLGVSERQGHRDQQRAEAALVRLLWSRYRARQQRSDEAAVAADSGVALPSAESLLEAEVQRLGTAGHRESTDVAGVLRSALDTVAELAASRAVRLAVAGTAGLPPVVMDPDVLRHGLMAVLSYALERAEGGTLVGRSAWDGAHVELSFTATGARRVAPDDRRISAARQLLELQGGTFAIEETAGCAVVRLGLPRLAPTTVFVVDDDPDFVQLLQRYLSGHPYEVLSANTPVRAIDLARESRPDVVVLDVLMPNQDGWETLRRLRNLEATRDTPVIVCSVMADRALAESLGASRVLPKPVTQRALLTALRECLPALPARPAPPAGSPGTPTPADRRPA